MLILTYIFTFFKTYLKDHQAQSEKKYLSKINQPGSVEDTLVYDESLDLGNLQPPTVEPQGIQSPNAGYQNDEPQIETEADKGSMTNLYFNGRSFSNQQSIYHSCQSFLSVDGDFNGTGKIIFFFFQLDNSTKYIS